VTLGDVNNLFGGLRPQGGGHGLNSFYTPQQPENAQSSNNDNKKDSQQRHIRNLQGDIERNVAEIEMLKQKLQMKN